MTGEPAKAPTLLVVDDDPAILVLVDRIATDLGFTVVRESDGRAALASLPLIRPDGAIVDVGQESFLTPALLPSRPGSGAVWSVHRAVASVTNRHRPR